MNNLEVGKRIKQARMLRRVTLESVAREIGVARSTVQRYENGKIDKIKLPVLESIAKALNVNSAWLFGETDDMEPGVLPFAAPDNVFSIELKSFPLIGEIACGAPTFAEENREGYIMAGADIHADFCLRARGDSMINARICDGDIVFIRRQDTVDSGDIAAVVVNNDSEATLKRVVFHPDGNVMVLKAENPKYDDLIFHNDELSDVHILGKAVAFQSAIP